MGLLQNVALPAALLASAARLASAASFRDTPTAVYDVTPRLRIAGEGFRELDASTLELRFAPRLTNDTDYKLEIHGSTVMTLTLQPGKRWMDLEEGAPPMPLYLFRASADNVTLLEKAVQIATVIPSPSVEVSSKLIYMQTTPRLVVNGRNFNAHNTQLFFNLAPTEAAVAGKQIQMQVLSSTQIALTKTFCYDDPNLWSVEPGPLKVVAINTGAGRLLIKPEDGGVVVAEIQADLNMHGVWVQRRYMLNIYQSTKSVEIKGSGFVDDIEVRFASDLRGGGTNFTITDTQPDRMTLELVEGSTWRTRSQDPEALPEPLIMLAADPGDGWVPLGPTAAKLGTQVATVFEDPSIVASEVEIFRTLTRELQIVGTGFTKHVGRKIKIESAVDPSSIHVEVVNRTMICLSLSASPSSEWAAAENLGPLTITGIDTGAGMKVFDSPVTVATVVADSDVFLADSQPKHPVA